MRSIIKTGLVAAVATGAIAAGGLATPASAQPIAVGNLVSVQISNVLNNNDVIVAVPINAAAAICGVSVSVLAVSGTDTVCDARGNQQVEIVQMPTP